MERRRQLGGFERALGASSSSGGGSTGGARARMASLWGDHLMADPSFADVSERGAHPPSSAAGAFSSSADPNSLSDIARAATQSEESIHGSERGAHGGRSSLILMREAIDQDYLVERMLDETDSSDAHSEAPSSDGSWENLNSSDDEDERDSLRVKRQRSEIRRIGRYRKSSRMPSMFMGGAEGWRDLEKEADGVAMASRDRGRSSGGSGMSDARPTHLGEDLVSAAAEIIGGHRRTKSSKRFLMERDESSRRAGGSEKDTLEEDETLSDGADETERRRREARHSRSRRASLAVAHLNEESGFGGSESVVGSSGSSVSEPRLGRYASRMLTEDLSGIMGGVFDQSYMRRESLASFPFLSQSGDNNNQRHQRAKSQAAPSSDSALIRSGQKSAKDGSLVGHTRSATMNTPVPSAVAGKATAAKETTKQMILKMNTGRTLHVKDASDLKLQTEDQVLQQYLEKHDGELPAKHEIRALLHLENPELRPRLMDDYNAIQCFSHQLSYGALSLQLSKMQLIYESQEWKVHDFEQNFASFLQRKLQLYTECFGKKKAYDLLGNMKDIWNVFLKLGDDDEMRRKGAEYRGVSLGDQDLDLTKSSAKIANEIKNVGKGGVIDALLSVDDGTINPSKKGVTFEDGVVGGSELERIPDTPMSQAMTPATPADDHSGHTKLNTMEKEDLMNLFWDKADGDLNEIERAEADLLRDQLMIDPDADDIDSEDDDLDDEDDDDLMDGELHESESAELESLSSDGDDESMGSWGGDSLEQFLMQKEESSTSKPTSTRGSRKSSNTPRMDDSPWDRDHRDSDDDDDGRDSDHHNNADDNDANDGDGHLNGEDGDESDTAGLSEGGRKRAKTVEELNDLSIRELTELNTYLDNPETFATQVMEAMTTQTWSASEMIPGFLFLGDEYDAENFEMLESFKITRLINCAAADCGEGLERRLQEHWYEHVCRPSAEHAMRENVEELLDDKLRLLFDRKMKYELRVFDSELDDYRATLEAKVLSRHLELQESEEKLSEECRYAGIGSADSKLGEFGPLFTKHLEKKVYPKCNLWLRYHGSKSDDPEIQAIKSLVRTLQPSLYGVHSTPDARQALDDTVNAFSAAMEEMAADTGDLTPRSTASIGLSTPIGSGLVSESGTPATVVMRPAGLTPAVAAILGDPVQNAQLQREEELLNQAMDSQMCDIYVHRMFELQQIIGKYSPSGIVMQSFPGDLRTVFRDTFLSDCRKWLLFSHFYQIDRLHHRFMDHLKGELDRSRKELIWFEERVSKEIERKKRLREMMVKSMEAMREAAKRECMEHIEQGLVDKELMITEYCPYKVYDIDAFNWRKYPIISFHLKEFIEELEDCSRNGERVLVFDSVKSQRIEQVYPERYEDFDRMHELMEVKGWSKRDVLRKRRMRIELSTNNPRLSHVWATAMAPKEFKLDYFFNSRRETKAHSRWRNRLMLETPLVQPGGIYDSDCYSGDDEEIERLIQEEKQAEFEEQRKREEAKKRTADGKVARELRRRSSLVIDSSTRLQGVLFELGGPKGASRRGPVSGSGSRSSVSFSLPMSSSAAAAAAEGGGSMGGGGLLAMRTLQSDAEDDDEDDLVFGEDRDTFDPSNLRNTTPRVRDSDTGITFSAGNVSVSSAASSSTKGGRRLSGTQDFRQMSYRRHMSVTQNIPLSLVNRHRRGVSIALEAEELEQAGQIMGGMDGGGFGHYRQYEEDLYETANAQITTDVEQSTLDDILQHDLNAAQLEALMEKAEILRGRLALAHFHMNLHERDSDLYNKSQENWKRADKELNEILSKAKEMMKKYFYLQRKTTLIWKKIQISPPDVENQPYLRLWNVNCDRASALILGYLLYLKPNFPPKTYAGMLHKKRNLLLNKSFRKQIIQWFDEWNYCEKERMDMYEIKKRKLRNYTNHKMGAMNASNHQNDKEESEEEEAEEMGGEMMGANHGVQNSRLSQVLGQVSPMMQTHLMNQGSMAGQIIREDDSELVTPVP